MRVDAKQYSKDLVREFSNESEIFNLLILEFLNKRINDIKQFNDYMEVCGYSDSNDKLNSYAFEHYNNLHRYDEGGVLGLFKERQPEWGAPEVRILKEDVPASNVSLLKQNQTIYRGLMPQEHTAKVYRQSWTLDIDVAERFAKSTYEEKGGIVVTAKVNSTNVVYYNKMDSEKEVIVEYQSLINVKTV